MSERLAKPFAKAVNSTAPQPIFVQKSVPVPERNDRYSRTRFQAETQPCPAFPAGTC